MRIWEFLAVLVAVIGLANSEVPIVDPHTHNGPIGNDYTFICQATSSSGAPPSLVWERDNQEITNQDGEYTVVHMQNESENTAESKLTIINAQEMDEGPYVCRLESTSSTFTGTLNVYKYFDVKIDGSGVLVDGEDLEFTCTVNGATTLPVVWTKDGETLPNNDRYELNNTLVIIKATKEDAGVYTCSYTNEETFSANVTVGDELELNGPKSIKYTEGERARFVCSSTSVPEPKITWAKVNGTLDDRFKVETKTKGHEFISQLELTGVKMSDRGEYICTGDNGVDIKMHTIMFRVRDRLAALWPFIGIMCEVIILIAIIFIHEKCTQGGDIGEDDEDDEAMEPIKGEEKATSDGEGDVRMRATKE